jgi:tellurite resistance-related uncharacterized protein
MITSNLDGGLGNQLFQIFTALAYSIEHRQPFFFFKQYQLGDGHNGQTIRYTYWNTFLSSLKFCLKDEDKKIKLTFIKEQQYSYVPLPKTDYNDTNMLVGYFQSPKYFDKQSESIFRLIRLDNQKEYVKNNVKKHMNYDSIISMHFRIGDFKYMPSYHPILKYEYYKSSIFYILEKEQTNKIEKVLYFCEDDDLHEVSTMIQLLKKDFPKLVFERGGEKFNDWGQLMLMSLCKYNIIANSTFSWWGAYFNTNENKIVCYPAKWFGTKAQHDTSDLCPEDWTKIHNEI